MLFQTKKIILFVLLCILTACSTLLIDRYQDVGEQLLLNAEFTDGLQSWQVEKTSFDEVTVHNNTLQIKSDSTETNVQVWQDVPMLLNGERVRLKAALKTEEVRGNGKIWSRARLLLLQPHKWQGRYFSFHIVAALTGTHDWQTYSKAYITARGGSGGQVRVQLLRCGGTFSVKELSLYQVEERDLYVWSKWLLIGLWTSFIGIVFLPVLKTTGRIVPIFAAAILFFIVVGTAMPGGIKNSLKHVLLGKLERYIFPVQEALWQLGNRFHYGLSVVDITKIAHFFLFAAFTVLLVIGNPNRSKLRLLGDVFMLACATEFIQFYIDGRSPLFTDVLIDMTGGFVAFALCLLLLKVRLLKR